MLRQVPRTPTAALEPHDGELYRLAARLFYERAAAARLLSPAEARRRRACLLLLALDEAHHAHHSSGGGLDEAHHAHYTRTRPSQHPSRTSPAISGRQTRENPGEN
jgi:hypothetical protein